MAEKSRSLARRAAAVVVAMFVFAAAFVFAPPKEKAFAAGTDLYVGYSGRNNNFSTVQEAVNKAASINPTNESSRVTIHIAPGTYRQQVIVQTPFVTFVNDEPSKGDVVLTWYYGIGYKYYSANSKGYYDAGAASSKSSKNVANHRWGATVQLWSKASNFKAKNIVFENSFNRYLTQEELADGVECTNETLTVQRYNGVDVQSKAYTERAAALSVDASYCEFLNCKFLSSQDTLYTGASPEYYKNCHIEGQTDYIFGEGNVVFDSCDLVWKGYSSGSVGGYITAARSKGDSYTGYLFTNCRVVPNSKLTVSPGYFGRPWRQDAKVLFLNTTLANGNMIRSEGWTSMSGVQPETVDGFKEYGTKLADGSYVNTSGRKGHTLSASDAANIDVKSYMNSWTPSYLNSNGDEPSSGQNVEGAITLCGGWYEEAYVEWDASKLGNDIKVSYAEPGGEPASADSQLIRENRVDIPGLKGDTTYNVKVEGSNGSAVCTIKTMAFDRSGYAHWNASEGVGAYNNDGTLKSGVTVIYVTDQNKDSITFNGKTGLYNIFASDPSNVDFRLVGTVGVPAGAKANNGQQNDGSNMLYMKGGKNVTIEGVGCDAALYQWGFDMKHSTSCEVRNLHLAKYPDDGISVSGGSSSKSSRIWIHNNTIEKGYNAYAGNGIVDDDKAEGDGSTDIKWAEYVTVSYNVYKDCHKTSLVGGGTSHEQDWITYHHNYFNNTESRNPRIRNAHVHSYNNYFYNNKQYGIGASYNSKAFSEANYYEKTNLPLDAVNMGSDAYSGTIKSYADKFDSCNMGSGLAYAIVNSRGDKPYIGNLQSGGAAYDNFDTDSSKMYSSYALQSADAAKAEVVKYAGRMRSGETYNAGTIGGEDVPPVINEPIRSELVSRLDIKDDTYGSFWSIAENVSQGDKAFGDRAFNITTLPELLAGAEHIITACDSKKTDADLAVITAAKDIVVYVAMDQRNANPPSWLTGGFSKTGDIVGITDGENEKPFDVYAKELSVGESVVLGTNGMMGNVMGYTAFVKAKPEIIVDPVVDRVWGDADCDGQVMMNDVVLIMQSISNPDHFGENGDDESHITAEGKLNADVYENGTSGVTPKDSLQIQLWLLKQITTLDPYADVD